MAITIRSFGFDYSTPPVEAVWIADVRDIDSAVYGDLADTLTGLDPELSARILETPTAQAWVRKFEIDVLRELVDGDLVAVGCSHGRHRSVVIAEAFANSARTAGLEVVVEHSDIDRPDDQRDTAASIEYMNVTPISSARTWYSIKNATASVAEIFIDDQIGEDYWTGGGVTSKQFVTDLAAVKAPEIHLHLNSPGGSVFDGVAIYNALVRHPAKVTTYIDGLAASIASVIALAGDRVVMADNALFMIHNPAGAVQGTADDMRKMAEVLDRIRETALVGTYAKRSNLSTDELVAAIDAETWYSADEALAAGFVDEVAPGLRIAAHFDLSRYGYRHVPTALAPDVDPSTSEADDDTTDPDTTGAVEVGSSVGAIETATPEAYIPGIGFHRFTSNHKPKE